MRKRLISLFAAVALLGSVSIASAGTVTTGSDTNITLGGFVNEYFIWGNNQGGGFLSPFATNANGPTFTKSGGFTKPPSAQTNFNSTAMWTRLNFAFENKTEGVSGLIDGDFLAGNGGLGGSSSVFRLRDAYFKKTFAASSTFQPYVLIGQTWALDTYNEYSLNNVSGTAGAVGGFDRPRVPQVTFGANMDFGSIKINPQIGFEDLISGVQESANDGYEAYGLNYQNVTSNGITVRTQMPGIGLNIPITFNTGFGSPATFYVNAEMQPVKVTSGNANINSESKTSWRVGTGLELPIYAVSLLGNVSYSRGFAFYNSFVAGNNPIPASYWVDQNNSLQTTNATQWDIEAKLDFNKLAQLPFAIAGGYSQQVFSNYNNVTNNTLGLATSNKASTIFANVTYNMTKSIMLGLEYDRNKTYYANDPNTSYNANVLYLMGQYSF
ncbi:hypothetical protein DESAMIL20_556 [Desulfurella amilsii]|uniref:Porin n=1 Tax=Desulfurella amilsii TaxID=1562698 RepID=A0A1X4XYT7_9BACT|nr:hypothetical protein [Desulfurella amilsii]OSS42673.1 hypothetical protein DESAMIL20_556 [Desulfurella amilsii]